MTTRTLPASADGVTGFERYIWNPVTSARRSSCGVACEVVWWTDLKGILADVCCAPECRARPSQAV